MRAYREAKSACQRGIDPVDPESLPRVYHDTAAEPEYSRRLHLPPSSDHAELLGHEFEHLLEQIEGLDLRRWRA